MKSKVLCGLNILLAVGIVFMWKKVFFVHLKSDFYLWSILIVIALILLAVFLIKDYYPKKISLFRVNLYVMVLLGSFLVLEGTSYGLLTSRFPNLAQSNIQKIIYQDLNSNSEIKKDTGTYESLTEYLNSFRFVKECSEDDGIIGTMDRYYEVHLKDGGVLEMYSINEKQNTVFFIQDKKTKIFRVEQ